jgi:hypothetical protein
MAERNGKVARTMRRAVQSFEVVNDAWIEGGCPFIFIVKRFQPGAKLAD